MVMLHKLHVQFYAKLSYAHVNCSAVYILLKWQTQYISAVSAVIGWLTQ